MAEPGDEPGTPDEFFFDMPHSAHADWERIIDVCNSSSQCTTASVDISPAPDSPYRVNLSASVLNPGCSVLVRVRQYRGDLRVNGTNRIALRPDDLIAVIQQIVAARHQDSAP